jgi:hemerythrin superfamily protein
MNPKHTGKVIGAAGAAALGLVAGLAIGRSREMAMKAAMALTGDWERQLKAEHTAVRKLLKAMTDCDATETVKRASLLEAVDEALTRHALEEEKVIYPALKSAGSGDAVRGLFADHAEMKTMVRALQEMPPEDGLWAETARALRDLVHRHVKDEEGLFPLLHDLSDKKRNRTLTDLVRREAVRVQ